MKIYRQLAILACAGAVAMTTGCRAFTSLFTDEEPVAIQNSDFTPDAGAYNDDIGPGLDNGQSDVVTTDWMTVKQFDEASKSSDDWTPIPGKLGFPVIYFAYDQDRIGFAERSKLDSVASYMKEHKIVGLIIEGHCDERGSDEFNRALGERRAIAVKDYLISLGVPAERIKTISFGEERPAVPGHDEAAYSKNRRAELVPAKM